LTEMHFPQLFSQIFIGSYNYTVYLHVAGIGGTYSRLKNPLEHVSGNGIRPVIPDTPVIGDLFFNV